MAKIGPDALRNLTAIGTLPVVSTMLGVVVIAGLGLAYWGNVTSRERYLQSRNFRLLSDVAEQTEGILTNSQQLVSRSIGSAAEGDKYSSRLLDKTAAKELSDEVNKALQVTRADSGGNRQSADRRIAPAELWRGEAAIQPAAARVSEISTRLQQFRPTTSVVGSDLRYEWTAADARLPKFSFQLPAAALFAGSFNQARWDRAFSTMALATPDGRIVLAVGSQAAELKSSGVAPLLPVATEKATSNLVRFASVIANEPVRIAGIEYRMFTQPCCRGAESLAPTVNASPPGMVLIGLAETDALRSLSLAISPVLVLSGAAFVMACLVGWTFLKCSLMGVQQRLGRHDVINLLASGLFGVALATILLLTVSAYSRLSADVDAHLQHLASTVDKTFTKEIEDAAGELQNLVDQVRDDDCARASGSKSGSATVPDPCQKLADPWWKKHTQGRFITLTLVNDSGRQAVKTATTDAARRMLDVSARAYYQHARSGDQLWKLPPHAQQPKGFCPDGCYLEHVSSWNTGRRQAVLAMPTRIGRLPVATLSMPMPSLLSPVLPPGFEFAVVDLGGIVQFHSDPLRNGQENLLLETDQNSRLRSLLTARSAGTFNAMYWGYPYRGYVRPTGIPDWSIVVFHAKQSSRALVLEWFTVAMLLAGLYTIGWVLVMLPSLWHGASWLWPDPLRRHWYLPLGGLAVVATAAWLAIAWRESVGVTAIAGILIPVLIWAVAYMVLAVRPAGAGEVKQWTEMCRSYRFAGTALFLLTAAVPAASFYALSYDRHIEAFVKDRQIRLGQSLNKDCTNAGMTGRNGDGVIRYVDEDHDGAYRCLPGAKMAEDPPDGNDLHEAFEAFVPYFTSASVALRELMHEKSEDGTWSSERNSDRLLTLKLRAADSSYLWQVNTALPAIVGWRGTVGDSKVVLVALGALLLLIAVLAGGYFVIAFLLRRVLLADIVEPIPRRVRIVTQVGQHLQVICLDPAWLAHRVNDLYLLSLTPAANGPDARTLAEILREVSEAPASQRIGISDLEESSDDAPLLEKKLEVVEAVMALPNQTVLLFTRRTTSELDAWIRERCQASPDRDRWSRLIARLRVTELPVRSETSLMERWTQHLRNLVQGWREEFITRWQDLRAPLRWRARLVEREGQSDPKIDEIATELQKSPAFISGSLTRDQILEEIEESADERYREIWDARSEDERVLLEHVAGHGLASAASRRVVRKLLAAGLLRKDPELRLMSESFRRFVLEPERRREVAVLEKQAAPSLWDRLRIPLAMSGTLALLFLVVTQREALDTTVSMAVGMSAAVPTLVRFARVLQDLGFKGGSKENT